MRKIITAITVFLALNAAGQTTAENWPSVLRGMAKDTLPKIDTVVVPIYEKYDTIPATILYGENGTGNELWRGVMYRRGFVVLKGFAVLNKDKKWQWTEQPKVSGVLDDKKRPLVNKDIIQIL